MMQKWIALLRGINVGGHQTMPMAALATAFESAGCRSVRTYIQSGNVVFTSPAKSGQLLRRRLEDAIEAQFGFRPNTLILSESAFRSAIDKNPFPEAVAEPKTLHFVFLESAPNTPDMDGIGRLASSTERFALINAVFYIHAPGGVGRSKLAAGAERKLGVSATARNLATVLKLSEMLEEIAPKP